MSFTRPRPCPPKAKVARDVFDQQDLSNLASRATYLGSPHHTSVPKYNIESQPRQGSMTYEEAESQKAKNPSCLVCPPKWIRKQQAATKLLRDAIIAGNFEAPHDGIPNLPSRVWIRDPDDQHLIYEAKPCNSEGGYKAYPLTTFQSRYNLPIEVR
jgi:hypothetical protein